jgi:TetR/AcrR family transcriptional regulator, regulator of cefoperazone and chloramphenicol sensitivity
MVLPMIAKTSERNDTRADLIDAALDLFGQDGFAAVSTRALADRAGANLAAIQYHFGGKDALYRAVIDHVIEIFPPRIGFAELLFTEQSPQLKGKPEAQAALLKTLSSILLRAFLGDSQMRRIVPFFLREMIHPSPHFDHFYAALPERLHSLLTRFVALVLDTTADDERAILQAHALIGQIVVFQIGRPILLRRTGWDEFNPQRVEQIIEVLVPSLQRTLGLPVTELT